MSKVVGLILALITILPELIWAGGSLLYFEAQGVGGYSPQEQKLTWYSQSAEEVMQKTGVGLDLIQRISSETADLATLALQGRLVYDEMSSSRMQLQLYNAYLKVKGPGLDLWIGHDRPAMGLSSYLDNHAELLVPLSMEGFGFDRDWGIGISHDETWGNWQSSLTTSSGMALIVGDHYLWTNRLGLGVLQQDNYTMGFTLAVGRVLDPMGYVVGPEVESLLLAGADLSYFWDNYELRVDALAGQRAAQPAGALLARFGVKLLEDESLKLEWQEDYEVKKGERQWDQAVGASWVLTPDWTLRSMVHYEYFEPETRVVVQAYYYLPLL